MTITGLWNLLGQHVSPSIVNLKKESASFLNRNKKKLCIGIDASIYLYLALKNPKTIKELAIDFVLNHDISNFLHSYFENLRQFLMRSPIKDQNNSFYATFLCTFFGPIS